MKKRTESDLVRACRQLLESRGWLVRRLNVVRGALKRGGYVRQGEVGDPDLLAVKDIDQNCPYCTSNTNVLLVECKIGKNPVSMEQRIQHAEWATHGARVIVVRDTVDELERMLT